ncbi:hypothetical protein BN1708_010379, partial [Verticillium longisporum]
MQETRDRELQQRDQRDRDAQRMRQMEAQRQREIDEANRRDLEAYNAAIPKTKVPMAQQELGGYGGGGSSSPSPADRYNPSRAAPPAPKASNQQVGSLRAQRPAPSPPTAGSTRPPLSSQQSSGSLRDPNQAQRAPPRPDPNQQRYPNGSSASQPRQNGPSQAQAPSRLPAPVKPLNVNKAPAPQPSDGVKAAEAALSAKAPASERKQDVRMSTMSEDLNMVDLELIHNFTTFTYATLGSDPQVRQMMKTTVIRMALECEYIMHTVLAVSALHLSHYRHARADFYVTKAMQHHQVGARVAIALMGGDLHKEDCEHLHLFCLLTLFYALGSPRKSSDDSLLMGQSAFPNWIFLLRSHEPIIERLNPHNYTGPLSPVFALGRERWHVLNRWEQQLPGPPLLGELSALVAKAVTDPDLLNTYSFAIEHLRRVLTLLVANGDGALGPAAARGPAVRLEGWDVIMWKWQVAKDFLPLLQGPDPAQEAVAIFAHFLILIKKVEDQWWLEGWSTHLMAKVWEKLDQEHRLWVQWPIEELGWVPP